MLACGTRKTGGDGVLALLRKRIAAGDGSGVPVVELPIRLHLLDGRQPALPHFGVSGAGTRRVAHPAEEISDLSWAAHAVPVLSDELEHGEVRLVGGEGFQGAGGQGIPDWIQDVNARLELLDRSQPV